MYTTRMRISYKKGLCASSSSDLTRPICSRPQTLRCRSSWSTCKQLLFLPRVVTVVRRPFDNKSIDEHVLSGACYVSSVHRCFTPSLVGLSIVLPSPALGRPCVHRPTSSSIPAALSLCCGCSYLPYCNPSTTSIDSLQDSSLEYDLAAVPLAHLELDRDLTQTRRFGSRQEELWGE
ncbi:hypothetical protein OH77DRAFT_1082685 [Trametes cingulata]|nr:hypothetical protein OH77DRAFT_1082685 [Trametes cingulata]